MGFILFYWVDQRFHIHDSFQSLLMGPLEKRFVAAVQEDLEKLDKAKSLHQGIKSLKEIQIFSSSSELRKMFQKYPLKIATRSDGKYKLEIFVDGIEEAGGTVIQYDLVEISSGNTVWELGRTFPHKLPF